jgi:large subunit ribosomal protein L21
MYAVFRSGGKQYRAAKGDVLRLEKIEGDEGATVKFDQVLLVGEGRDIKVGSPILSGSTVSGKVVRQGKSKKVSVVKFKRRQNYLRQGSHRQFFTEVEITGITAGTAKKAPAKPATQKAEAKKEAADKPAVKEAAPKKKAAAKQAAPKTAKKPAKKVAAKKPAKKVAAKKVAKKAAAKQAAYKPAAKKTASKKKAKKKAAAKPAAHKAAAKPAAHKAAKKK